MLTCRLLDPSCSGSGIVNRLDYLLEGLSSLPHHATWVILMPVEQEEADGKAERLEKLAAFQLQMILHAFKCE